MAGPAPASWAVEPGEASARLVIPGVWRLRLPIAWEGMGHVNAYLLERADGGVVLVDCGTAGHPTCASALEVAVKATGHELEDVRVLAATHAHSDDLGLAALVLERSGAELWIHPDHAHLLDAIREPERTVAARTRRARAEGVPAERLEVFANVREESEGVLAPFAPRRALVEGVVVESAVGPWTVLETGGHCPSHVCLVQRELGLGVVGDLICAVFVPWLEYGYSPDPVGESFRSLDRISGPDAGVRLALPGHGRPIDQVGTVVDMTREGLTRRLQETHAAVRVAPGGAYDIALRIFGPEGDHAAVGHVTEVLGYLRHLRRQGHVVRETAADGTYRYRSRPIGDTQ